MLFKYTGFHNGRLEFGNVWADTRDEAIARLRATTGLTLQSLNGEPVSASYVVCPEATATAMRAPSTPLHDAIKEDDLAAFKRYIAAGTDVNARNMRGETVLEYAVGFKNVAFVRLLIANGADSEAETSAGCTVIEYARRLPDCDDIIACLTKAPTPMKP